MKAIEVKQLTKRFGTFTAVDHISFEVEPGEIFGFLGANGAGKTTAMRMLCGLSVPTSGEARVAGFDVYRESESIKRNIGYMSQKFSLYEDLKVWENIRLYAGIYGMKDAEIARKTDELLERLDFTRERNTMVQSLPLGWKQKLAFSVSIFHDPAIVFLDEPTGGVDPYTRRQFWEMIYEAADRGITVFVTTHYMDEAAQCDRIIVMDSGKVILDDTPKKVFSHVRELKNVGLDVPQTSELIYEFLKEGYNLPKDVLTEEECIKAITTLFRRKGIKPQLSKETQEQSSDEQIV